MAGRCAMTWRDVRMPPFKVVLWTLVLPLAMVAYVAAWLTPATWWYQPVAISIADAPLGGDPRVEINRVIKRGFDGRYTVSIWREPSDGHIACAGSDALRYKGGLYKPHHAPLTQWADDEWCARLPEGRYYAEACWTVLRPFRGIVPDKTTCRMSNIFAILPADGTALR